MPHSHFSNLTREQIHELVRANASRRITEKTILEFAHHYCTLSPSTRSARKIHQKMKSEVSYPTLNKWYRLTTSQDEKIAGAVHSSLETARETEYLSGKDPARMPDNKSGKRKRNIDPMTRAEMWADLDEQMREALNKGDTKTYLECLDRRAKITPGITAPDTKLNVNLETVLGGKGLESIDSQLYSMLSALQEMNELPPAFQRLLANPEKQLEAPDEPDK